MTKRKRKTQLEKFKDNIYTALEHKENAWLNAASIIGDVSKDVIKLRAEYLELNERITKLERKRKK